MHLRVLVLGVVGALLAACGGGNPTNARLATQEDSVSYVVGYQIGANLKRQGAPQPGAAILRGLAEGFAGTQPSLSDTAARNVMMAYQTRGQDVARRNDSIASMSNVSAAAKFFPENAKKPGVQTTKSGLQWKVIKEGKGPRPKPTSTVTVHYKGTLLTGEGFDSSYARGPTEFALNEVIPGLTEAVGMMNTGAKYQFWIPAVLAYGERGSPPMIGPDAALIFEVELVSFK